MKNFLLPIHLIFVGLWLGCVLTEALFERALLGQGRTQEKILVRLHQRVDVWIEIPAFCIVLVTGALLLATAPASALLHAKIGFALLAIIANVYCVWLVFRRAKAAETEQWQEFAALDHLQHKIGAIVLLGILAAMGIGIYLYSHG
ncbi:MAG: hypothetical protein HYZ45_06825 [Burkholderiales bacterium]|nr:hypothetical protein [Burkholderiales bacterium]